MNNIPYAGRLTLAVLVVLAFSAVDPESVNAILVLILVGIVLNKYKAFNQLFAAASGAGKKGK